jgi:hypothetical protein
MNPTLLKGLERFISESNKACCCQLVYEWQRSDSSGDLLGICRHAEQELRLADLFDRIETDALLRSDTFHAIADSILKRYFAEIHEQIIKVEPILKAVENRHTAAWYSLSAITPADNFDHDKIKYAKVKMKPKNKYILIIIRRDNNYHDCLYYIAKMQGFYLAHIASFLIVEPKGIWKFYVNYAHLMDSNYRHFRATFGTTLTVSHPLFDDLLKKAADVVEGLYLNWYLKELTTA